MNGRFVCGTRAVVRRGPHDFRVVCATCGGGGSRPYHTRSEASSAAVKSSARPCPVKCGAK